MNEGANREILVPCSSYGPTRMILRRISRFPWLMGLTFVAMLKRHGRMFRIDLAEARRQGID